MELTKEQKEAVEHPEVPLLILAGPGSGKTTVLTHRCLWLIEKKGIDPKRLFVVTFTNKAANELKERLQKMIGYRAQEISAGTFHSLCARWLRRHPQVTGGRGWSIVDERESLRIVRKIVERTKHAIDEEDAARAIALAKANLKQPEDLENRALAEIYAAYNEELRRADAFDFGDLVARFVQALESDPRLLEEAQSEFDHVLVDEFQDINRAQDRAIRLLAQKHRRITAVGDMDQAIFSFQGGCLEAIAKFKEHWPDGQIVSLTQNFRSTKTIVQAASQLIRRNRSSSQITLWTENEQGKPIRLRPFISEIDEADWVAAEIHRLIQRTHDPVSPKDIAVLVRVMAHATPVEHALMHRRIPYEVVGARPFLEYPEVRELVTYLKLLENPNDLLSLKQIMSLHGIGIELANRVIERCRQLNMNAFDYITYQLPFETAYRPWEIRKLQNLSGAYNRLAGRIGMGLCAAISEFATFSKVLEGLGNQPDEYTEAEVRLEQVAQLAAQYESARKDANLSEFLSFLLDDTGEDAALDMPKVQIMSIHRAKGLEFRYVFIVGATADTLPHHQSLAERGQEGLEEERRLFYVALTRAKEAVAVSWPLSRQRGINRYEHTLPSPFIDELPKECVQSALEMSTVR